MKAITIGIVIPMKYPRRRWRIISDAKYPGRCFGTSLSSHKPNCEMEKPHGGRLISLQITLVGGDLAATMFRKKINQPNWLCNVCEKIITMALNEAR